jgi:hypothetical protein
MMAVALERASLGGVQDSVFREAAEAMAASQRLGVPCVRRSPVSGEWEPAPRYGESRATTSQRRTPAASGRTRAPGSFSYARTPEEYRRNRLDKAEAETYSDAAKIAAELEQHHCAVAFAAGEVVRVQRRRSPAERLAALDRESLWRS